MKTAKVLKLLAYLNMRSSASREMVAGVLRFAASHHDLEVQFADDDGKGFAIDYYRAWKPDALIVDATNYASLSAPDFAAISGRAVVFAGSQPRTRIHGSVSVITTDNMQLAAAARDLFLSHKLTAFGYVGTAEGDAWSVDRENCFQEVLNASGRKLHVFQSAELFGGWREQEQALCSWLKNLPKPCGVWAACDHRAKQVLDACRLAKIAVPEQVQVLGVDDETYVCEQTISTLSSLAPDFEAGGYASAAFLYRKLTHKKSKDGAASVPAAKRDIDFGLKGVVERLSTADVNGTARRVAAAREYIRKFATSGVSVPDVAASLRISVRLLEKDYKAVTGRTILADLQATRLAKVKEMLRKTKTPIDNIGPFCGFQSPAHLKTLFRRSFGMTMSEYRGGGGAGGA